jgi:DNA-directed RNA polymerase specialized sigma24 family protein
MTITTRDPNRASYAKRPGAPEVLPLGTWVQPFPGDRSDLRLALIAGMQVLPPTHRAVLLRDVLAFSVAAMLGTSVTAVKSSLQRARARQGRLLARPRRRRGQPRRLAHGPDGREHPALTERFTR